MRQHDPQACTSSVLSLAAVGPREISCPNGFAPLRETPSFVEYLYESAER